MTILSVARESHINSRRLLSIRLEAKKIMRAQI